MGFGNHQIIFITKYSVYSAYICQVKNINDGYQVYIERSTAIPLKFTDNIQTSLKWNGIIVHETIT